MKLINYTSAAMVALTLVALGWQGALMLDKILHLPGAWAPGLAALVIIAVALYDWSRRWIARHESYQQVAVKVQSIAEEPRLEKVDH